MTALRTPPSSALRTPPSSARRPARHAGAAEILSLFGLGSTAGAPACSGTTGEQAARKRVEADTARWQAWIPK
ncbi:hypothetical protein [Nonomuraea lactucae]|uniref:hypothetical protein n=1 Tax=Nonomuraea lactucae TaxID=2249762 RepID=UPI000DE1E15F|nr:hypothetical protein [Nonomuraea lactucae]